jgi:5-formyltetrahydrofolate cyclo-ligase
VAVIGPLHATLAPLGEAPMIAGYVADDGELDPELALGELALTGATIVLPAIDDAGVMSFVIDDGARVPGRFDIPAPTGPTVVFADIDAIIVPLVLFDDAGHRVGRGGGYYDRYLADAGDARPLLIGLAHDLQQIGRFDPAPHDVTLDFVITPTRTVRG